jgi:Leucine-rich repeat (LRR) protein
MYQNKIIYLLLLLVCCELVKCEDVQTESIDANLNCEQYANDLEIISNFPFTVNLNPQKQGAGISTAILDSTNTLVIMIQ